MEEKSNEPLIPTVKGHTVNIPNDVQQLTVKDSTVFIGNHRPHRSVLACIQGFVIIVLLLVIGVGVFVLQPNIYRLITLALSGPSPNDDFYPSYGHSASDRFNAPASNVKHDYTSQSDEVRQKQSDSTSDKWSGAILYSMQNPYSSMGSYYEFSSSYIARDYQTTISFFTQSSSYSTYLDDISVNASYGYSKLINGDFENGTYGWDGVYSVERCYAQYTSYFSSYCHRSSSKTGNTLSQTFSTSPGNVLKIGFKLRWDGSGTGNSVKVTIYP